MMLSEKNEWLLISKRSKDKQINHKNTDGAIISKNDHARNSNRFLKTVVTIKVGKKFQKVKLQATGSAALQLSMLRCDDALCVWSHNVLASLIETFARFQAGFLSSGDFHRILSILKDFHRFS